MTGISPELPRWQRALLPGALVDDARVTAECGVRRSPRSLRDWLVDLAVLLFALLIGAIAMAGTWSEHSIATAVIDIAAGVGACLALWARRDHRLGLALVVIPMSAVSAAAGGAALVAVFTVTVCSRLRAVVGVFALSLVASVISAALYSHGGGFDLGGFGFSVGFSLAAVVWGLFIRARQMYMLSLQERAFRTESEHRIRVEQARRGERARIAREMHDVLAHRLSLLSVHAGALEYRPDAPPEEIARAAGVIRDSAHTALQELRGVIGLLREDDENGSAKRPQPTLAHVPGLIEEARGSGMHVREAIEFDGMVMIPDVLGRTVYRIVQEGLTNARKHAPGSLVEVRIRRDSGDLLEVSVVTRPPVGVTIYAHPASGLPRTGTGTGLIGLAERATLAGGKLEHGSSPDGGYILQASFPWPA